MNRDILVFSVVLVVLIGVGACVDSIDIDTLGDDVDEPADPVPPPEEPGEPVPTDPPSESYDLVELSQFATIHDGPIQLVHDRRASGGRAVIAPWKYETFGGAYPSSETLGFSFEQPSGEVSVWVRIYTQRENSAGWRLELPGGISRTIIPDQVNTYEWVEAYRGTLTGTQASLRPLGSRSSVDTVLITSLRDSSGFDALLDLPVPGPVPDARYFVSMSGSDSASGSMQSPFRTIQKGVDTAQPGDTILVREGRYPGFRLSSRHSARPDAPITLQAYPGERVILDSYLTTHDGGVIYISNPVKHWVFDGFEITDSNPLIDVARSFDIRNDDEYAEWLALDPIIREDSIRAVRMLSSSTREFSSHLTFQNLEIHGLRGTGISGNANDLRYLNNHIYDLGYPTSGYGWYSCGDGVVWDGNIVHDVIRAIQSRTDGTPSPENMLTQNNLFYRNGRFTWHHGSSDRRKGPAIVQVAIDDGPGGKDNTVINNIFLYNGNGYQDQTPGSLIAHNAFIGNGVSSDGRGLRLVRDGVEVINNVFFDNRRDIDDRTSYAVLRGNVMTDQNVYRDPYRLDFTVVPDSPTINAGVDMRGVVDVDFSGTSRPQNGGWDAGAIER